ncbi:hypothetical protein PPERSA_04220 [Pseudocohnilembus persalinus]|uniref:Uncharacterized protein n=1 Tax=Pseudocohnilembus persalinus TaxID=266149 RepID=A0A0V0QN66_PSEPJ|nr:hypothetical protein PPERSA_04220 [Pseudocohnilembus persalinus]|eukprot:KRX03668.1 hypothetical protein PPERSA_04220 [Pseudocohnilembus persalinus]
MNNNLQHNQQSNKNDLKLTPCQSIEQQDTDGEVDSVKSVEFQKEFPNLKYKIIVKNMENQNKIFDETFDQKQFNISFEDIMLSVECKPPSLGQIKMYKNDWINVFDEFVEIYCSLKNETQQKLNVKIYDNEAKIDMKEKDLQNNQIIDIDIMTDNDYGTRDFEKIFIQNGNKKYELQLFMFNPFQQE